MSQHVALIRCIDEVLYRWLTVLKVRTLLEQRVNDQKDPYDKMAVLSYIAHAAM